MNAPLPALRENTIVSRLEAATALLAEADMAIAKELIAVGKAAEEYARSKKLGEEIEQRARAVSLKAERKLGELLALTPKNEGGRPTKTGSHSEPVSAPTLADLGVDKKQSMIAQQLAALPEEKFNAVVEGKVSVRKALAEANPPKEHGKALKEPAPTEKKGHSEELAELRERYNDLAETARELEDRLTAFEATEPDEQQKLIADLQKKLRKAEGEIEHQKRRANDLQLKCNELIREVKKLRRG